MKKLLYVLFIAGVLFPSHTFAATEDEQWPLPNESEYGHHSVLVQDNQALNNSYSILTTYEGSNNFICNSIKDPKCANSTRGDYRALLPVCESEVDVDCIVSLEAINAKGEISPGKFIQYTYNNAHPNRFEGDGIYTPLHASDPSIWSLEGASHSFGSEYGLVVSLSGTFQMGEKKRTESSFSISLFPISRLTTEYTQNDVNGYANYPKCIERYSSFGNRFVGCGGGAQEFGRYRCALKMIESATCLLQHGFPEGFRFRVEVRLANEPTGMFHGRLSNPTIEISPKPVGTTISVEASSMRVPILYSGDQFENLPSEIQSYWNQCLSDGSCRGNSRQISNNWKDPKGRNVQDYALPFGERALKLIDRFASSVKDTSVAAPGSWNIKMLEADQMESAAQCFKTKRGFLGVVSTNSTSYSEGPPLFQDGTLTYKLASLHFLPNGEVFRGRYDLILRSDVARCLYGFSSAPISASVSVITADGQNQVATTVVSEKNNWLHLSAAGFTFSSPRIEVRLTQDSVPLPKPAATPSTTFSPKGQGPKTITCAKGKLKKKITGENPKCPNGYKGVVK